MNTYNQIPHIPFYFIRHGETDWNKHKNGLCAHDDIMLNETGVQQIKNAIPYLAPLGITKIYTSPLARTMQTTKIINEQLNVPIEQHHGLYATSDETISYTLAEILNNDQTTLIVSHGEVYRILLRILNVETTELKAKNGSVYLFKPSDSTLDYWSVYKY